MEPTTAAQTDKEYETQHFGFYPFLTDEIEAESIQHLSSILGVVKTQIEKKLAGKVDHEALESGLKDIEAKYAANFEQVFQKLGPYLNANIFKVPRHVLLKEDAPWDDLKPKAAKARLAAANAEMERKREAYKNLLYRRARIRGELQVQRKVCTLQDEVIMREVGVREAIGIPASEETLNLILYKRKQLAQNLERLRSLKRKAGTSVSSSSSRSVKRARMADDLERHLTAVQ